jgi:ankyrin repeat protein
MDIKENLMAKYSSMPAPSSLTDDDKDDLLLACRYGDLEDVQAFVTEHGPEILNEIHDDNGNCVLHMVCANGHTGKYPRW